MKLSHSQMEEWEACELRWAMNHVYDVRAAPNEHFILGRAFHKAVEEDGLAKLGKASNGDTLLDYDELCRIGILTLAEECAKDDPDELLDRDVLTRRLRAMLRAYVEQIQATYHPSQEPERRFEIELDDGTVFVGVVDGETSRAKIDWKTANKLRKWLNGAQHTKAQATAYFMLDAATTKLTFIVFATDPKNPDVCEVGVFPTTRTQEQIDAYKERVMANAAAIQFAQQRGSYTARPTNLCAWCGYLGACPLGQAFLKRNKLTAQVPILEMTKQERDAMLQHTRYDAAHPQVCKTCLVLGKITSDMHVCARPIKNSFQLYTITCQSCGVQWGVRSDRFGTHRSDDSDEEATMNEVEPHADEVISHDGEDALRAMGDAARVQFEAERKATSDAEIHAALQHARDQHDRIMNEQ